MGKFTKAFDCINHGILLIKLKQFGDSRYINFLLAVLIAEKPSVTIKWLRIFYFGCPLRSAQGSLLGPLILIILHETSDIASPIP